MFKHCLFTFDNDDMVSGSKRHATSFYLKITTETLFQLAPGEHFPLNLEALDELGHEITTIVYVADINEGNSTSEILLEDALYVLSPNETIPFSFTEPEALYNETKESKLKAKRRIQFVAPYSTLINRYSFEMELQACHPGFIFSKDSQKCVCNTKLSAVQR